MVSNGVATPVYKPNKIVKKTNKNGKIGNTFIKSHYGSGYFEINDDLTIDVFGSVSILYNNRMVTKKKLIL